MKRFFLLMAILVVGVFLLSACGAESSGDAATQAQEEADEALPPTYAIGEILQLTNWEFTVTDSVAFMQRAETGGTISMVFEPTRDDRIFVAVPVEITNISGENRQMLPTRLQTPTQLTARLRYTGVDGSTNYLPIALNASVGDVIDRVIGAGNTVTGRIFFQIPPEIENSTGNLELQIRTNAGDVMGVFQLD